jgi:SAM-dependent methyltransferase
VTAKSSVRRQGGLSRTAAPAPEQGFDTVDTALLGLLRRLGETSYQFTTPAPTAHRRILLRRGRVEARNHADLFGWNLPFRETTLEPDMLELMAAGGVLRQQGAVLISAVRVATVGEHLFLHTGFPVPKKGNVFFGPDSYRFVDFLRAELPQLAPGATVLDVGAGAGVGGIFAAGRLARPRVVLADVSPEALRFARINAAFSNLSPVLCQCDGLPTDAGPFDLVVSNPPYICGSGLTYSDGGGALGAERTIAWAKATLANLAPGGRLLLYSGSAIVRGYDAMQAALAESAKAAGCDFRYRELDPDVFPTTLLNRPYWKVERIAAVGAVMARRAR